MTFIIKVLEMYLTKMVKSLFLVLCHGNGLMLELLFGERITDKITFATLHCVSV